MYSGSFNPMHIGHYQILKYLCKDSRFDLVYLIVSPKNPLKESISEDSGRTRYLAACDAVARHPELTKVRVDDIELNMAPPHYTLRTLDTLKRREPDNDFTLIIGADNLSDIHRWRDFPRLLTDYGVAVYPRKGFDLDSIRRALAEECIQTPAPYVLDNNYTAGEEGMRNLEDYLQRLYEIEILDAPMVDISSTEIRNGMAMGRDMSEYLM